VDEALDPGLLRALEERVRSKDVGLRHQDVS
jgi:hypothetical protein